MWRSSDQEALGLDGTLLLPPQQQGTRSHDSLVHHAQLSQDNRCTLATASEIHSGFPHELQQALLSEAVQSTADHSHTQLDVDNITLLGLGGDNVLAQFHRSLTDQTGQTLPELHAALAASLGVLPVTGQEGLANASGRRHGLSSSNAALPQSASVNHKDHQSVLELLNSGSTTSQMRSELGDLVESDNQSDGDEGSVGAKRKGPMTEEDRKRRRQEINRRSARRIRERKSLEMERLKQQVQHVWLCLSAPCECVGALQPCYQFPCRIQHYSNRRHCC
ncbi:hypothetical protein ABBQ32_003930 [Trebouxia sp. C0010 RCD-2024]